MNDIRITHVEVKPENKGRIIAAFVIGLAVVAAGAYTYGEGWWKAAPKPAVSADQLPQLTPPIRPEPPKPI
ncbi:MAG TPA: hypothetical protein VN718_03840 [Rhizomicrobium sp.]|nr:hypothetical protein [Rhizomicrobium sp.]